MAFVLADRVKETTITTGTGTITLAGASTGYQSFAVIGNGNTTYYAIAGQTTSEWEVGIGTYTSAGTTLSRTTVLASSNGGSLVTFSAGTKDVFVTYPAGRSVNVDSTNTVVSVPQLSATSITDSGNLTFTGTGNRITGDFSSTPASRVAFQTSTANGNTNIEVIPNGTSTTTALNLESDPALANGTFFQLGLNGGTDARLTSAIRGTGTYLPMTFYTGGSERMRLDTSGNLGIGTSGPGVKLDVAGSIRANNNVYTADGSGYGWGTLTSYIGGSSASSFINFTTASTERMRIDSSGNVGIGTSSPSTYGKLGVVSGAAYFGVGTDTYTSAIFGPRPANDGVSSVLLQYAAIGTANSFWKFDAGASIFSIYQNSNPRFNIDSSGNVGIGVTPSYKLDVYSSTATVSTAVRSAFAGGSAQLLLAGNNTAVGTGEFLISHDGSANAYLYNRSSTPMIFGTSNTERMRLDSSGNLGIGTASPTGKLDVRTAAGTSAQMNLYSGSNATQTKISIGQIGSIDWDIGLTTSSGNFLIGGLGGSVAEAYRINRTGTSVDYQTWSTSGAERMRIDSSGRLLVNLTTSKVYGGQLQVVNAVQALGNSSADAPACYAYDYNALDASPTYSSAVLRKFGSTAAGNLYFASTIAAAGWAEIGGINVQGGVAFGTNSGVPIIFTTTGTERMRIDSSGNVGIGTSSPTEKLDVSGNLRLGASAYLKIGTGFSSYIQGTTNTLTFGTNSADRVTIDSSGNLLVGTASAATPSSTGYISTANTFGFKNRIINGAMMIDQRNSGAAQTITGGASSLAFNCDRWQVRSAGANATVQQVATNNTYRMVFTGAVSVSAVAASQSIEALNCVDMAGQNVTLSLVAKSTSLTSLTLEAYYANTTNTFGTWGSPTVTSIGTQAVTISTTESTVSWTFAVPSAATTGIQIRITGGALLATQTLTIGQVQLEKGSTATSFDYRPYGTELALCQRYYETFSGATLDFFTSQNGTANTDRRLVVYYAVPKRAAPTLTTTFSAGTFSSASISTLALSITATSGGTTSGCQMTAYTLSSEL